MPCCNLMKTHKWRRLTIAAAGWVALLGWGGVAEAAPPVASPKVWLTAEAGVIDDGSGGIERWEDQSGNGNHFEQATAAKRPVWLAAGLRKGEGDYVKLPPTQNGNNTWGGSLGSDFIVDETVVVTALAAFDHLRDGFSNPITVQLWQRNDGGTALTPADDTAGVLLEELVFTPADPGALDGSHRWKPLPTPRTLSPGAYTIFAWGHTGTDSYAYNVTAAGAPPPGVRTFGSGRYSNSNQPSQWPQNLNGDYYRGAGNFRFHRAADTVSSQPAVQFDGTDDGLQAIAALNLGQPSTVFIAYQRTSNDFGYILQNSSGPHWCIRSDGYYNNGWVRYAEIPWGVTQADTMLTTAAGTRAWRNHDDLTQTEGLAAGSPNRLALGGGNGIGYDPLQVKIAEVIAYDRQLSEAEILATQNYLGQRYGIFAPVAATPEVLPMGDLGTGSVAVTITSGTAAAEIRYTTDGSEPTATSTLYGGSFSVPRGTSVKARAFATGLEASGVAVQYYGSAAAAELPVTGAAMWLRADRGVETDSAGRISRWRDLTGSGNDVMQVAPWQRPAMVQAFSKNGGYAIQSPETASDSTHAGTLAADFVVTESLEVTELGAHDSAADSFGGAVTVQIWTRDDRATPDYPDDDVAGVLVAEMEFTNAAPGTLVGLKRYKPLPAPVTLAPGAYSVLAWGYTGVNSYKNSSDAYWNEAGLQFVGKSRYSTSNGTWPTYMDQHPVKYNGCGNFRYHKTATAETTRAAVAFDGSDDGLWAAATSNLTRPATVYLVFDQADYGLIIQSTTNGWWFIRADGAYADGWVVNRYFGYNRTHIAGMTAEAGSTRFYLNGEDWTVNSSVGNAPPGRLALGGGSGYSIDPTKVKIAEVVAFNRVLTKGERWQLEDYLANRYKSQPVPMPPVVVSPASNYGAGSVTVSLSHPVTGAVLHYTTDGSVPTAASPVFGVDFSVPRGTRVRAIAVLGSAQSSVIAEAYYGASGDASDLPVTGARMWLRAEVGVEADASGQVNRWRDLTGNGNDLQQEFGTLRPQLLTDGFNRANLAAIHVPAGNGASNYAGSLGEDFVVTKALDVTHLGAFDHLLDGFAGTITVQLWSRNDNGTPDTNSDDTAGSLLAQLTFTAASPGTADGPLRFKPLTAPVTLAPGAYTVFAWGYTGADRYFEGTRSDARDDSRFRFVGNSRYTGTAGAWPVAIDNNFLDYNGAANFKVSVDSDTPVRPAVAFDGADDGLQGVASMNFGRPSTVLMVFRKEGTDSGYMLQNTSGGSWWFRNDGFYSNGWVRYENFPVGRLTLAAMASSPTSTRAFLDGFEVTGNSDLTNSAPGRLAMGGGSGQQNDPVATRVAELVVYDRILNPSEMWQLQNYLATRHRIYQVEVDSPTILPVAGYGTGEVEVTLATTTPGAAIRYTTDGSEPTAGSALYGGAFSLARNTTVKARAFLAGTAPSGISNTYYGLATSHPLPVTDTALWLRGDSGVELRTDGSVARWRDLSGNGRDALPGRPTTAPSLATAAVGGTTKIVAPVPAGVTGNGNYTGTVGTDFKVEETVEITHLGVFDSANNGIAGSVTVRLHRVNENGTPDVLGDDSSAALLATQVFSNATPGTLDGSLRFIPLGSPLSLVPGRYLIESAGWTGPDSYVNSDSYEQTRDRGISYYERSRYNTTPATSFGNGQVNDNRYLAASSFKFRKPGATAVGYDAIRFDGVNDGLLGPANYLLGRPATIFMVFNQLSGTDGRLLQSGSNYNFLLGPHVGVDGLYCDGWVAQHTILRNQHSHVVGVYEGNQTRYYYNGQELTQTPGYTGVMGRLALGGAEGTYSQPCNADLAELVIYERSLSESERQQVTSALAVKYNLPLEPILPPVASPDGGYYATGQTLVYSHPISGVEIRYTNDGSEPTETSTLASGPLVVAAGGIYKAKAFKAGYLPSGVQESVFAIDPLATYMPQRSALQLWLRAGVNTETEGGVVTSWRDLSGSGMDAAQATVGARPTLNNTLVGGAPGVVFDGTDDFLKLPPGLANFSQGLTAIVVARPNVAQNWARFFDLGNGSNSANIFLAREATTTNLSYGVYASSTKHAYAPNAVLTATNAIYTVTQQPSGAVKIHHNGSLALEDAAFPLPTNIKRYSNLIGESNWPGSNDVYSGAISEIILYNSALNDLDRETLEAAVRARYGIASTATATVAFSPDPAQLYPAGVAVSLTCVTPASQIHYTLDGSQPDEASPLYGAPLQVNSSTRIRARAFTVDFNPSPFSEATYLVGQPPSSGDGFLATYFDDMDLTGPSLTRVDPTINFDWGGGSPDPAIGPDQFSVRWTGKLMPRFAENYTFYTASDDGQRLGVDLNRDGDFEDAGELLIDDWTVHGETERASAPVPLVAGQLYDFKMEMYENGGSAAARLRWSSFSEPKAIIPQSQGFSNAQFAQTVTTPVISPAGGTYTAAVDVTVATATAGATIYYTTDGSIPDTNSQVYGGTIPIGADATVRARAYKAGFNPSGVASTVYDIDAQPPVISLFAWSGVAINDGETITAKGTFTAQATDNQGVASAEFYYRPTGSATPLLVGRDTWPHDGWSAAWDIATISDGAYTVTVRVYDVAGAWSELSRNIQVALAMPSAPVIVSPASGATVQDPVVALQLTAQPFSNIRLYRDNVLIFSGYASNDGTFNYSPSLPTGSSVFKAVAVNRAGSSPDSNAITVNRVREFPQLQLAFDNNTVVEGAPVIGTITLPAAEAQALTVQVTTNKASQVMSVEPVVIPAGATTGTFMLAARQDTEIELLSSLTVTAAAVEHRSASAALFLGDDDYPTLELTLDQYSVAESHGTVVGVIRRTQVSDRALRVTLQNTNPSNAAAPEYVDIPANQTEVAFSVSVINDTLDDDNQLVKLRGVVLLGTTSVAQTSQVTLEVRDDEGPLLTLALANPFLSEGAGTTATVSRSGAATGTPLVVTFSQTPSGQLTVPASVTIPAGQGQATFAVSAANTAAVNGTRGIVLRASAAAFSDGLFQLTVTDETKPELTVSNLSAPASVLTEAYASVSYQINNQGAAPAVGPFFERIFLSRDLSPSPDDILVRQLDLNGDLVAGGHYGRNTTVLVPRTTGIYYLIVTVDAGEMVAELDEGNNTAVLIQPIEVRAAYSATVQTAVEIVPTNTPVVFTGSATRDNGTPAAFSMVNIHLKVSKTTRILSAITNSLGQFTLPWTPLRNEGGIYTIGACHPGTDTAPPQDSFEILTMGLDAPPYISMHEAETVVVQGTLRNPNGRALTGIAVGVTGLPSGLTITPNLPSTTLAAGTDMQVSFTVSANAGFSGNGSFPITVTTTEGVTMQAVMGVNISLLTPSLTFNVGRLDASVLRGGSNSVSFTVTNTGGLETGPVQLLLPAVPWLTLASANPLPSIPPGGSADVSLLLSPDATVPLTLYTGSMAINPANGAGRGLAYNFRVVSDLRGDLTIDVVDELFFFTAEAPKLAGAQVVIRDAVSSAQVATTTTGVNGLAAFTSLPEGWYRIDVSAPEHDSFSGNYYVNAGQNNTKQIFISKQLVKYSWKVEEVEIQDVYRVTIETKFETNVPAPVVTATPSAIDVADLVGLGQTKTVNITLENHGFIAAQHSKFRFSEHPFYLFTPLVENIGTIPAKSSLVVPVTVRRIGVFGDNGEIITEATGKRGQLTKRGPGGGGTVPCGAAAAVDYSYPCGEWLIEKVVMLAISGVQGNCTGTGGPGSGGYGGFLGGFYGGFTGPGGPGGTGPGTSSGSVTFTSPDPCLAVCLLRAIADCAIGFLPVGCFYSAAQCLADPGFTDTCGWALAGCLGDLAGVGPVINAANCIYSFGKCFYESGGSGGGAGKGGPRDPTAGQFILDTDFRNFAPETAEAWSRCEPILRMYEFHYGSKDLVLAHGTPKGRLAMVEFSDATLAGSPGGVVINGDETIGIEALAADAGLDLALVQRAVARWNRTRDYYARSIFELADVPAGESTDFMDLTGRREIATSVVAAFESSRAKGFIDPFHEFLTESANLRQTLQGNQGGTCATVKIQLSQDVVMTRTAFRATLELENERTDGAITEVGFTLQILDEIGQPSEDLFNVQVTKLTGLEAIDGTGEIPSSGVGSAQWTLIPRDTAAQEEIKRYTVGGVIHYIQNGTEFNIPVENVPITVQPDASLKLKYFHQRDVISDDPHTDPIEPPVPYKLAVMVENNGHGDARDLHIISGQPVIVENEKGLFIDFKVIATEVDGTSLSPSLTADFGTLTPGQRKIATWYLTSTLQGLFTDYKATFEHVTGLGDTRISLMESVEIHEMIRMIRAQGTLDDGAPDFLTNDVKDANDYPDTVHYSNGGTDLVTLRQTGTFSGAPGPGNLTVTLDTGAFTGWSYLRLPDPAMGNYRLVSATRADGRVLPMDANVWQSDRTFIGGGRRPLYENILHLADHNSSGVYTLVYQPLAPPDSTPPSSLVNALPALSQVNIPVTWSGTDNLAVSHYDIYVSVDGGAYTLWKDNTTELGGLLVGTVGSTYSFYSIATDNAGNSETKAPLAEATTQVAVLNLPPVIGAIANAAVDEGDVFTLQATATDPDGPAAAIRFSIGSDRAGVVIDPVSGIIRWNTSEADGGAVAHLIVVATDSGFPAAVANRAFTVTVGDVNNPPTLMPVAPQSIEANGVLIVDADAADGDSPQQTVSFALADAPPAATIDPASGVIQWLPTLADAGRNHVFTVTATDNGSPQQTASTSFTATVTGLVDQAPVFTQVPVVLWLKGKSYSLSVTASDPEGAPITLTANTAAVAGATFADGGSGSGSLAWNTTGATAGTYAVPVTATANGLSTNATVRIRVENDELYWQWAKDLFGQLPAGFDLSLLGMDADPDGDKRGNVHEMALLTHPLVPDSPPVGIQTELLDPFAIIGLNLHRRKGSEQYVDFDLASSPNPDGPWQRSDRLDWSAFIDATGDDDGRAETEKVDFELFELYPGGVPQRNFYRIETTRKQP